MPNRGWIPSWRDHTMLVGGYLVWIMGLLVLGLVVVPSFAQRLKSEPGAALTPPPVDGERAYQYLKDICAMGPRPAGTPANDALRAKVAAHFKKLGASVVEQPFTGVDPRSGQRVRMTNLVGSWNAERKDRVLVGAHYDTRPFPDEERDPARRNTPFIGANDPASGIALLMELAHHQKDSSTPWGVDLVLFDGEELVYGADGEYFLGSKEFARRYVESPEGRKSGMKYAAGIVVDLIGGKNVQIPQEPHSLDFAQRLVHDVWSVAAKLKATAFRNRVGRAVLDDHLPLNNGGIPAIDIIDFDYPYWHTADDLPENCSAASLGQVGKVVATWLQQPKPRRR